VTFTPTPEQQAIVLAATETKSNLLVNALAGAAKTSTLVLIAQALKSTSILCLAFNVRIKDEMKTRMPGNTECMTLNGLGHRAWSDYLGQRLNVDTKKTFRILTDLIDKLDSKDKSAAYQVFADLMRNIDFGKSCGYIPTGHHPTAKALMDDAAFFAHLDDAPSRLEEDLIRGATLISLKEALSGTIDFGDQLLMPTLWPAIFPFYPCVLVDEAQDLSALNHAMLRKLAKKRLIAVGDPCQSIYGFRGAHQDSMGLLKEQFDMTELHLTISFRCPISVVEAARWRAPAMQYPEWAKPGTVERITSWDVDTIPQGSTAIICRNNAPLFSMAIKLLRDGRYPELVGNDLGKSMIKQLKKLGPPTMRQREVLDAVEQWRNTKLEKARNPDRVHDHAACLRVFAEEGATLADAITYAERIFSVQGPVKLMTGHKSKGLEFETVFILDRDLIKTDFDQEKNLLYVMQTRAKDRLVYVESKGYFSEREIGE
jgi:DNA helicase-2/ATP-dependent DNA helicase PcrA